MALFTDRNDAPALLVELVGGAVGALEQRRYRAEGRVKRRKATRETQRGDGRAITRAADTHTSDNHRGSVTKP